MQSLLLHVPTLHVSCGRDDCKRQFGPNARPMRNGSVELYLVCTSGMGNLAVWLFL